MGQVTQWKYSSWRNSEKEDIVLVSVRSPDEAGMQEERQLQK